MFEEIISVIKNNYYLLAIGLWNTICIWLVSIIISIILAFFWGTLREERVTNSCVAFFFDLLAYIIQGVPFYILALISFFYIAPWFGLHNPFWIGSYSLGFCSSAYGSQIVKSCYQAIPEEQWILAKQLGYSSWITVWDIIIPQIIPRAIPLYINESDQLLKSTSILSTLGILDLTKSGINIINNTFEVFGVYSILFIVYLSLSMTLRFCAKYYKKSINIVNGINTL